MSGTGCPSIKEVMTCADEMVACEVCSVIICVDEMVVVALVGCADEIVAGCAGDVVVSCGEMCSDEMVVAALVGCADGMGVASLLSCGGEVIMAGSAGKVVATVIEPAQTIRRCYLCMAGASSQCPD